MRKLHLLLLLLLAMTACTDTHPVADTHPVSAGRWVYKEFDDKLLQNKTYLAFLTSEPLTAAAGDDLAGATVTLRIRFNAIEGKQASISLSKGDLDYLTSTIPTTFDDGRPAYLSVQPVVRSVHVASAVLPEYDSLVSSLTQAKTMTMKIKMEKLGERQISFKTEGLKWNH